MEPGGGRHVSAAMGATFVCLSDGKRVWAFFFFPCGRGPISWHAVPGARCVRGYARLGGGGAAASRDRRIGCERPPRLHARPRPAEVYADVRAGTAGAALVNELPSEMPGEGAFNPALGALADDGGGAFPD